MHEVFDGVVSCAILALTFMIQLFFVSQNKTGISSIDFHLNNCKVKMIPYEPEILRKIKSGRIPFNKTDCIQTDSYLLDKELIFIHNPGL